MPPTFQLKIVLPESPVPPRAITSIDVPAADGRLTLLANHQDVIVAVVAGTAIITASSGERESWQVSAGAIQMEKNVATLLVTDAKKLE